LEPLGEDGDDDDGDGKISPEHPSPILHAPRDNISRKGNPSLRYLYMRFLNMLVTHVGPRLNNCRNGPKLTVRVL
jgi:hypothetical protein